MLVLLYETYARIGQIEVLARSMGRTKNLICREARRLGLTDQARRKPYMAEATSIRSKEWHKNNPHPRGMAGKTHSEETKEKLRQQEFPPERRDKLSQQMFDRWHSMTPEQRIALGGDAKRSWKSGWREIGDVRKYYRSSWEANYARYLEWLRGRREIVSWKHEPKTFWFLNIKRGTRSYLPDFEVIENGGTIRYHEVKGWMDDASRVKLKRMAKYYPEETIVLVDRAAYQSIAKTMKRIIRDWE